MTAQGTYATACAITTCGPRGKRPLSAKFRASAANNLYVRNRCDSSGTRGM